MRCAGGARPFSTRHSVQGIGVVRHGLRGQIDRWRFEEGGAHCRSRQTRAGERVHGAEEERQRIGPGDGARHVRLAFCRSDARPWPSRLAIFLCGVRREWIRSSLCGTNDTRPGSPQTVVRISHQELLRRFRSAPLDRAPKPSELEEGAGRWAQICAAARLARNANPRISAI